MSNLKEEKLSIVESAQKERIIKDWISYRKSMEAEIQSEFDNTKEAFFNKRLRYLETKHPFVAQKAILDDLLVNDMRDYWWRFLPPREGFRKLEVDMFVVLEYYKLIRHRHFLLASGRYTLESVNKINLEIERSEATMDSDCKQLALKYMEDATDIARSCEVVSRRYRDLREEYRQEIIKSLVDRYWDQRGISELKYHVGYILAQRGDYDRYLPTPFRQIRGFVGPNWENGGFGFCIDRNCFANENPQLFYWDSDNWPDETERLEKSLAFSSGIGDAHIEKRIVNDGISNYERNVVVFYLDRNTIRKSFPQFGLDIPINKVGSYIFMRCYGSRDFKYQFGEIINEEMIPLYRGSI